MLKSTIDLPDIRRVDHTPTWDVIEVEDVPTIWEVGEYSKLFKKLVSFLESVLYTSDKAYVIQERYGRRSVKECSKLAAHFRHFGYLHSVLFEHYVYTPDIELFRRCHITHPGIGACSFTSPRRYVADGRMEAEVFDEFIAYLRDEAIRLGIKKELHDWRYGQTSIQRELIKAYLRTMPIRTTKLLAVRCELQYREEAVTEEDIVFRVAFGTHMGIERSHIHDKYRAEYRGRIDIKEAMNHRKRFFSNPHGKDAELFKYLIGYVWKIEQSTAIHHHVLLIFDGQRVRDDIQRIEHVFSRWEAITGDAGYGYSTHYRKKVLIDQGRWDFGNIDCRDTAALERMIDNVAEYFTKDGQLLRVKPSLKARALTMGRAIKQRTKGPGRPRSTFS